MGFCVIIKVFVDSYQSQFYRVGCQIGIEEKSERKQWAQVIICFAASDLLSHGHIQSITFIVQHLIKFIFTCFQFLPGRPVYFYIKFSRERELRDNAIFSYLVLSKDSFRTLLHLYIRARGGLMKIIIRPFSTQSQQSSFRSNFPLLMSFFGFISSSRTKK